MNSEQVSLLILAGGLGSRYHGSKQVDEIGPNGAFLLEYAIYDALHTGFTQIVVVINKDIELLLKSRWAGLIEAGKVTLIQQLVEQSPKAYSRKKPWGTGHAVLCAKDAIRGAFLVLNADDFYGRKTLAQAYHFLTAQDLSLRNMGMIAFELGKTLSAYGSVSRGVCTVTEESELASIQECEEITLLNGIPVAKTKEAEVLRNNTLVSMNCWLLHDSFFDSLSRFFLEFYSENHLSESSEFYLPIAVQRAMHEESTTISVLKSEEEWVGLTYPGDKVEAREKIAQLIELGHYPEHLNL